MLDEDMWVHRVNLLISILQDKLPDYLSVQSMPYMDRVFSEVLRLHTIAQM